MCRTSVRLVSVLLVLGIGPIAASSAMAQSETAQADPMRAMEEVVTIGQRGSDERTILETAVPVDIITNEEIVRSGITETARLLQMLAPSFNFSTSTVSDGTDIVRPATLRGLGPDQTLVLVNGKRRHNSALMHVNGSIGRGTAGVDLNAIPPSAIDRIEILRDGASAQYGSDAIAGVINIILKDQTDGIDFLLYTGETHDNDGEQLQASINAGYNIFDTGFVNVTLEYRDRDATNRAGRDNRQQFNFLEQIMGNSDLQRALPTDDAGALDPAGDDGDPYCDPQPGDPGFGDPGLPSFSLTTCTNDSREASFNRKNHRYGDPDSENIYGYINSMVPFGDNGEFYLFGGLARRDGESGGFYRRAEDGRTVLALHPEGFLPIISTDVDDDSLSAGFRSSVGDWDSDTSITYGRNKFEFNIKNSNNVTLGGSSPISADAGSLEFRQTTVNWDLLRTVDWGWNDNVDLAFGAEFRVDQYEINAGDMTSWTNGPDDDPATAAPTQFGGIAAPGIQVFPGFRPSNAVDELRDATGLYAEAGTMLTDKFFLDFATRWEYYSDFGSTLNGKLAARYDLTDTFGFRGSASTGFRAPSLHQQYFNNTSTQFVTVNGVPNTPVEVGTFNSDSDVVKNGFGVGSLDEETSVNLSGGFTWMPTDNFNLTVDAYYIAIDDRIVLSGRFSAESSDANGDPCVIGTGNCPIADLLAPFPGVSAAQFFSNAIDTETTGVDIIAQWRKELSHGGSLQLTGALNLTETELDGSVKTPSSLQNAVGADQTLFSRQEILWLEKGQPREAFNGAIRYDNGPFSALLRANYFGEVDSTEDASNTAADQTFDAKTLWDIDVGWDFDFGLSLNVGGLNITDETPDENIPGNSFGGIFPYNRRTTPFGFNGGFWYARATFSLDH